MMVKNTSEIINDQQEINSIDNKTTLAEVNTFEDLVEIFKIKESYFFMLNYCLAFI